jgi:hypothetical protein
LHQTKQQIFKGKKMKHIVTLYLSILLFSNSLIANEAVVSEVKAASKNWVTAFNKGEVKYITDSYTTNATMITHPIGVFYNSKMIFKFWDDLLKGGASDLKYIEPKFTFIDKKTVHVEAKWTMNIGEGFITLEKWVKQADGVWRLELDDFTIAKQYQVSQ